MFHRQFPEVKISATLLRRLYRGNGIAFKIIKRVKKVIDFSHEVYRNLFIEMRDTVQYVMRNEIPLLFLDEAIFSFNTFASRAWAGRHTNISIPEDAIKIKTQALIAAISI